MTVTVRGPVVQTDKLVRMVQDGDEIPPWTQGDPRSLLSWLSLVPLMSWEIEILSRALAGHCINADLREALAVEMVMRLDRRLEHDDCIAAALVGNREMGILCRRDADQPRDA